MESANTKIKLDQKQAEDFAEDLKVKLRDGTDLDKDYKNIQLMIAGLADPRGLIRRTFSEALGKTGKAATSALCEALLNNKNVTVRRAAAKTLKLVGDPSALPHLLNALLNDADPVVQGSSAGAMAIFGEPAIELLEKVLKDPHSDAMQKGLASWGFSFIGAEAPSALRKAAISSYSEVRAAAVAALGDQIQTLEDAEAKNILMQAINDPSPQVRVEAASLLGQLQQPDWAEEALINKLKDEEPLVRKNAALSLMKLCPNSLRKEIYKIKASEKNPSVLRVIEHIINSIENE